MKKLVRFVSVVLACIFCLSFIACGRGDSGGGSFDVKDPPSHNGGTTGGGDTSGGGSEIKGPTLLDRAIEVAGSIDRLPTSTDLHSSGASARSVSSSVMGLPAVRLLASVAYGDDVSDPKNNSDYAWYLQTDRLTHDMHYTMSGYGDEVIDAIKKIKALAVGNVVQFDTWVSGFTSQHAEYIRMNYDLESDVVKIEAITTVNGPDVRYCLMYATYNAQGKAIVSAYFTDVYGDGIGREYNVSYAEDDEWTVICSNTEGEMPHQYSYMSHADLSRPSRNIITLIGGSAAFKSRGVEGAPGHYFVSEYGRGLDYDASTGQFVESEPRITQSVFYINNSNGERVGSVNPHTSGITCTLDVYELEGWDKLYFNGDQYTMKIGELTVNGDYAQIPTASGGAFGVYVENNRYPALTFSLERAEGATVEKTVCDALSALGLSFKDKGIYKLIADFDRADELREEFRLLEYSGNHIMTLDFFVETIDKYITHPNTASELKAMLAEPRVAIGEQTADTSYYEIHGANVSGSVAIDTESGSLDLSAISVTMNESSMLDPEVDYTLCAMITDGVETSVISEGVGRWQGGTLTVSGMKSFALSHMPLGEYSLLVYLAGVTPHGRARLTPLYAVGAAEETSFELVLEKQVVTVTANAETVTVSCADRQMLVEDDTGDNEENNDTDGKGDGTVGEEQPIVPVVPPVNEEDGADTESPEENIPVKPEGEADETVTEESK